MRRREREVTLLYGFSLIRDDVLNRPPPNHSHKDKIIIAGHAAFAIASSAMMALLVFIIVAWAFPVLISQINIL
jgi:hypothetical protein